MKARKQNSKPCKHIQTLEIIHRTHAMGCDELQVVTWCKTCGAIRIDDGYNIRPRWRRPKAKERN